MVGLGNETFHLQFVWVFDNKFLTIPSSILHSFLYPCPIQRDLVAFPIKGEVYFPVFETKMILSWIWSIKCGRNDYLAGSDPGLLGVFNTSVFIFILQK